MLGVFKISASGLSAQRLRMDITADNIANAQTTSPAGQDPFYRRYPIFAEGNQNSFESILNRSLNRGSVGVQVVAIHEDRTTPSELVYDPGHPHADERGYVQMPNVNVVNEMVNMISASRAYEANVTALNTTKTMLSKALEIGR